MATSTFVPNFSVFDPPSPTYSSTVSDSLSSMSPSTPSNSSPASNIDNLTVFDASGDFNYDHLRQGSNLTSGDWSSEGKGISSHGQHHLQQYHYLPQQELQQQKYVNQQQQQDSNVFPTQQQQQQQHFAPHHQFQPFQTGFQAQQEGQGQQPQLALAQPTKSNAASTNKANKKGAASQKKGRRGDNGAERRAIHNATERARRETLNGRFLDLAAVIPATSTVRRPSKPLIVKSALSFVEEALKVETVYREQINGLSSENERLLTLLNAERKKLGLEEMVSNAKKDFILPTPLSEMKATEFNGNQEDENENDDGSDNGYGIGNGSQDGFQSSTQSNIDNESDSGLSNSYQHFNDLNGFSMGPTVLNHPGQQFSSIQSNSGPFTAPVESFIASNGQHQDVSTMFFPANLNDGRRHSVSGFTAAYPQTY